MSNLTEILQFPEKYVAGFVIYLLIGLSLLSIFGFFWRRGRR